MLRPGDIVAGKYRIERELGAGGMGAVFVATNEVLQKRVAVKVMGAGFTMQPDAVARFFREAMSASKVRHPAIVEIYDAGSHDGSPWMAMQLLEGESLAQRISRGPLALGEILPVFAPVLAALDVVHGQGIVHRDLKPDNIFLERLSDGNVQPKLLDFGIAKSQHELNKLTASGAIMGTAHYLAPEQARDSSSVDPRTDLYAMGVVMYEALSGRTPHEATTLPELITKLVTEDPVPLSHVAPHVPPQLASVVHWCLARDPSARPQRASDVVHHLGQALAGVATVPIAVRSGGATASVDPIAGTAPVVTPPPYSGASYPMPPAPAAHYGAPPGLSPSYGYPARPRSSGSPMKIVLIVFGLIALLGGCLVALPALVGAGLLGAVRSGSPRVHVETDDETASSAPTYRRWEGWRRPFLVDVNHDGTEDIVGWLDEELCAFDGANGAELWCTSHPDEDSSESQTLLVGSRIVYLEQHGNVTAFELRTGEPLAWDATVSARVMDWCALGTDRVALRTRDRIVSLLTIETGAVELLGAEMPADCLAVPTTEAPLHNGAGYQDHAPGWTYVSHVRSALDPRGMRGTFDRDVARERAWSSPSRTEWVVITMTRGEPRGSAAIALERGGERIWEAVVPTSPLLAEAKVPEAVAISADTVFVDYEMTRRADAPQHVAAFRMADGARLWDVPVPRSRHRVEYLLTSGRNVYLATGDILIALDAGSGQERFQIGGRRPR